MARPVAITSARTHCTGIRRASRAPAKPPAVAATIISIVALVLSIIGFILFLAFAIPSINAVATCADDPTAIVAVWGVQVSCADILEQANR